MGMTWFRKWMNADHLALEVLIELSGHQTAADVGRGMEASAGAAAMALRRLVWRGVVEYGPEATAGAATWRVRPEVLEAAGE